MHCVSRHLRAVSMVLMDSGTRLRKMTIGFHTVCHLVLRHSLTLSDGYDLDLLSSLIELRVGTIIIKGTEGLSSYHQATLYLKDVKDIMEGCDLRHLNPKALDDLKPKRVLFEVLRYARALDLAVADNDLLPCQRSNPQQLRETYRL